MLQILALELLPAGDGGHKEDGSVEEAIKEIDGEGIVRDDGREEDGKGLKQGMLVGWRSVVAAVLERVPE